MSKYKITGVDRDGKRFRIFTDNQVHAFGINLWKGSVWILDNQGRYRLAVRVY